MKIIQTYWNAKGEDFDQVKCGWLTPETHWMAWALSCTLLRRFYDDVELYTTEKDAEIFRKFNIPYTKIHTSLNCDFIRNLDSSMWAYAKIYTYSLQEEPFLHVDGDVFIWEAFNKSLFSGDICVQNVEENLEVYHKSIETLFNTEGAFIPEWIYENKDYPIAYNMGIFGSNNIPFVKEYCNIAFDYYEKNKSLFSQMHKTDPNVNILPEQYLLYATAETNKRIVKTLISNTINKDKDFSEICNICKNKEDLKFLHTLGGTKKNPKVNEFIGFCLKLENKDCFNKIHHKYLKYSPDKSLYDIDLFSKYIKSILDNNKGINNENKVITELNRLRETLNNSRLNYKSCRFIEPFPFYNGKVIKELNNYYIGINPNHIILQTSFDFISILNNDFKLTEENTQPSLMFCFVFYGASDKYYKHLWISVFEFFLIEKLKCKKHTIADIISTIPKQRANHIYKLLQTLYYNEFLYITKNVNDIILQANSETYLNNIVTIKNHLHNIFNKIFKILNLTQKCINLHNIEDSNLYQVVEQLNTIGIKTKSFKCDDLTQIQQIVCPVLSIVNISMFIPIYTIITKIDCKNITIYNPISNNEEVYLISTFVNMWSGYIITLN